MSMIKCKGNRVKAKGNEAQIAVEFLTLIRSLDACAPGVLDAVEMILNKLRAPKRRTLTMIPIPDAPWVKNPEANSNECYGVSDNNDNDMEDTLDE